MMMRFTTWLFCGILCVACAATPESSRHDEGPPAIEIRGLLIQNRSFANLEQVTLLIIPTGRFVSCGNIGIRGQCATTFPARQYRGDDVEVKWSEGGRESSTGAFVIETDTETDVSLPFRVRVIITPSGKAVTDLIR